ncbi:MAG: hypothetical protein ABI432_06985 [Flavobacteriales bacterium]
MPAWKATFKDNGIGNFYTETVINPAGFAAEKLTSDGTVIKIYYTAVSGAPTGTVSWNLGIRNTGRLPDRYIVVNVIVGISAPVSDHPVVRDGSGGGRKR